MGIGGIGIQTISPVIGVLPSAVLSGLAAASQSSSGAGQTDEMNGRMNQLIQLINTFSPADMLMALLMANTTYQQSQAPASVTVGTIEMQLASQNSAAAISAFNTVSQVTGAETAGSQLNIQG